MSKINTKIEEFLAQETMSFWEGLDLYSQHREHKKNVAIALEQRHKYSTSHEKLVYELEKLVGVKKYTNRKTVLTESANSLPFAVIKETVKKAPENFEYKIKFKDLPEELKPLAIEKGELYNKQKQLKVAIGRSGQKNDNKTVAERQELRAELVTISERIVAIHNILKNYDENQEIDLSSLNIEEGSEEDDIIAVANTHEEVTAKYELNDLSWAEKKLLLKKTQSNVLKQTKRAETAKTEKSRLANAEKAKESQMLLDILDSFFKENPEDKK